MAKSTYISENTTQNQIDFMLMLDDNELDIFTLDEIKSIASNEFENINEIVENLVQKKPWRANRPGFLVSATA